MRLYQGDYSQETVYSDDPLEVARAFMDSGAQWLHVVDLDGAATGKRVNREVVRSMCRLAGLNVQLGGGIRSLETAAEALADGVSRVVVGTRLVLDPGFASELFEQLGDRAVAGIDTREGKVSIHGWTEESKEDGIEFARRLESVGCRRVIYTDVSTDGTLQGPNLEAIGRLIKSLRIPVIASGGVGSLDDLRSLAKLGATGVIVGKALYERRFTLEQAIEAGQA